MRFELALVSSDIYLGNRDLLDTHLDLLDTYIPSMPFFSLQDVLTWRHSQHKPSKLLQDISSRRHQDMSSRRLEDVFSVTFFRLPFKTSCEMSSRHLEVVLEDENLLCWRHVEEVFKTSWRSTNVCWVCSFCFL